MSDQNYTPIQHLLEDGKKMQSTHISSSPESEPIPMSPKPAETIASPDQQAEIDVTIEKDPDVEDAEVGEYLKTQKTDPEIHPELKQAGLQAIHSDSLDKKHKIELPISDEEVLEGLHKPITTSWRWLAEIALFMLKQGHLGLKRVHGHAVRIMQR
ncbi:MAG: hypothetical protein O3B87_04160 [bacterium]|nr:hypothetical protein [bacterium]